MQWFNTVSPTIAQWSWANDWGNYVPLQVHEAGAGSLQLTGYSEYASSAGRMSYCLYSSLHVCSFCMLAESDDGQLLNRLPGTAWRWTG